MSNPEWRAGLFWAPMLLIAIVLFTSCAQVATVRNVEPRAPSAGTISAHRFPTNRDARQDPETALSQTLEIAAKAWADLRRDPSNDRAVQVYNYSVGRITSLLQSTGKLPLAGAVSIGAGASAYRLTFTSEVRDFADPRTAHFIPAAGNPWSPGYPGHLGSVTQRIAERSAN
jgi:hypothetical protein